MALVKDLEKLEHEAQELARKDMTAHIRGYIKTETPPKSGIELPMSDSLKKEIRQLRIVLGYTIPMEDMVRTKQEARVLSTVLIKLVKGVM